MRSQIMYQVDAFSDQVFGGNPAAVLILDDWLPERLMQLIAAENNLAETAFARPNGRGWDLRWFTPVHEAAFCGHATLATAHAIATETAATGTLLFATKVGELRVERLDDGYRMDLPAFAPEPLDSLPVVVAGPFAGRPCFRNFENLFVELADEAAVRSFEPDLARIAEVFPLGLAITARGTGFDFVSRYFAPGAGIPEDPVTGSIHATLVPYWTAKYGRRRLSAYQASPRGGRLDCELSGSRVLIAGRCATFMKAEIYFPDAD